jgi:hypothetical protein
MLREPVGRPFTTKQFRGALRKSGAAWRLYKYELPIEELLEEWRELGLVIEVEPNVWQATARGLELAQVTAQLGDR